MPKGKPGRKNRTLPQRYASGRAKTPRSDLLAPSEVRRLRDMDVREARHEEWGTELGRLYLTGAITAEMYAAGRLWAQMAAAHRKAIGVFPVRTAALERGARATEPDPDTREGRRQARRERNAVERFFAAHAALVTAGQRAEHAVRRVCEENLSLAGQYELRAARAGLSAIADHVRVTPGARREKGRAA